MPITGKMEMQGESEKKGVRESEGRRASAANYLIHPLKGDGVDKKKMADPQRAQGEENKGGRCGKEQEKTSPTEENDTDYAHTFESSRHNSGVVPCTSGGERIGETPGF